MKVLFGDDELVPVKGQLTFLLPQPEIRYAVLPDEAGRQAHLSGRVAAALMAKAVDLFSRPPAIEKVDVLAAKLPWQAAEKWMRAPAVHPRDRGASDSRHRLPMYHR